MLGICGKWKDLLVMMVNVVPAPKSNFLVPSFTHQEASRHKVQTTFNSEYQLQKVARANIKMYC